MRTYGRLATSAVVIAALTMLMAGQAQAARSIGPGTSGYERINKGVVDLGFFDSILLLRHYNNPDADSSTLYFALIGGFTPRYFLANNLALGLNLNLFVQRQWADVGGVRSEGSDLGFLGHVTINYYIRLGSSFFWKPGLGGGGFYGSHKVPLDDDGLVEQSSIYGGSIRVDLGFVYYAAKNFNLRAGPDLLFRFGVDRAPSEDGNSFTSFDAGLSVGFGYSF